jgi:hypothetical protein
MIPGIGCSGVVAKRAWDITKSVYSKSKSFSLSSDSYSFTFSSDGTKAYFVNNTTQYLYRYSCATAYDIANLVQDQSRYIGGTVGNYVRGISWDTSGKKLEIVRSGTNEIDTLTFSTAWDLTSYTGYTYGQPTISSCRGAKWRSFAIWCTVANKIVKHSLSTSTNAADYSSSSSLDISAKSTDPRDLHWSADGLSLYVIDGTTKYIHQYIVSSAFNFLGTITWKASFFMNITSPVALFFRPDGLAYYVYCQGASVHEFLIQ